MRLKSMETQFCELNCVGNGLQQSEGEIRYFDLAVFHVANSLQANFAQAGKHCMQLSS